MCVYLEELFYGCLQDHGLEFVYSRYTNQENFPDSHQSHFMNLNSRGGVEANKPCGILWQCVGSPILWRPCAGKYNCFAFKNATSMFCPEFNDSPHCFSTSCSYFHYIHSSDIFFFWGAVKCSYPLYVWALNHCWFSLLDQFWISMFITYNTV